jgi:hypothetical protein
MVNKMGLIIGIRFDCCHQMEIEKGGIWQTPFVCFSHPQGWAIKKNVVTIQPPQFLRFSRQKMGHATCFWKPLDHSFPKTYYNPLLW